MIVFELVRTEANHVYQALEAENGARQGDFLNSIVWASLEMGRPFLSQQIIKALNYHAICCLHTNAGEYRPCPVTVGTHVPPEHYRVQALMDDFVNVVNRNWEAVDAVVLATFVLWRINHIHPFINGNGRTARAAAYYALCVRAGGLLPGDRLLPELLRENRDEYCLHLAHADRNAGPDGGPDLRPLHAMMVRLIDVQLASAPPEQSASPQPSP